MATTLTAPDSTRAGDRPKAGRHLPLLTAVTLALTAGVTATRLTGPSAIPALQRDPTALAHGQLWRLLSPVLVQTDASVAVVVANPRRVRGRRHLR